MTTDGREAPARVTRSEWGWLGAWTTAILVLTTVPYLLGWVVAIQTGQTFGGFVIGAVDGNSYLAKMAHGARGNWLFESVYTSEFHEGALIYIFYILLGKVAALGLGDESSLPLRLIWVFHLARLVCSAVLLRSVYRLVSYLTSEILLRRLAWLMIAAGGGLGWALVATGQGDWLGSFPLDMILPEGFTFLTLLTLPHIALARTLLLEGLLIWLRMAETGNGRPPAAGALWFGMALIVPFYPLVVGLVLGATLVLGAVVARCMGLGLNAGRLLGQTVVAGILPGLVVVYTGWVFATNPVMEGWSQQNLVLSPHPLHYLVAYGVPGLLAVPGAFLVAREVRSGRRGWPGMLLLSWAVVIPLAVYLPFNLQRRMVESYQVPLYVLAVIGLEGVVWPRVRARPARPALAAAFLTALLVTTPVMLVGGAARAVLNATEPIFHKDGQVAVADWLTENALTGDVVLCEQATGNFLPAWSPVRVFVGHGSETVNSVEKQAMVERFFDEGDDRWRQALLRTHGVDFVVHGPRERLLGSFDPGEASYLLRVYSSQGWDLYEVAP